MDLKIRLATVVLLIAFCCPTYSQVCDCVTTGNCPVPINDNGTYNGTLDVTVNGANDLGVNPITSVCFTITHTWIGDLSVALTSPSGVNYLLMADVNNNYGGCGMQQDNIDICIETGTTSPVTNNTEYMCNPGACPAGTCCLTGIWTVPCGGVTDPINGALEAPNCDLDDFNVPGDPANGTWTLTVVDVCNMDTGTLDNFSLNFANGVETCISCEAEGGTLDSLEFESCFGSPDLLLDIPPNYDTLEIEPDSSYGYQYVLSQNGVVLAIDSLADLTSQPAGVYQIFGISYYLDDSLDLAGLIGLDTGTVNQQLLSTTAPFCGDLSSNFITVTIYPQVPTTFIDTTLCQGSCVMIGSQELCSSGIVMLLSENGCDSLIDVTINITAPDTVAITELICAGGCVDIGGTQYCAPGSYIITLANQDGCDSIIDLSFTEIVTSATISPANPPDLTCLANSVLLDGSGSIGTSYSWSGPLGAASDQPTILATLPGDYTLTVYDESISPACESSFTVNVGDGFIYPDLLVEGPPPVVCAGGTFDLSSIVITDQNNTGPSISFHTATPAHNFNELDSTIISITVPTTYYVLATTGACYVETTVTVDVTGSPSADFIATDQICQTGEATVSYTGIASPAAIYNWDFDGGVAVPGTGPGPHQVSWPTGGDYVISLVVEENGCSTPPFLQNVTVEQPMPEPEITCSSSTTSVIFSWNTIPGAFNYNVNFSSGHFGVPLSDTTYEVTNLQPGEIVEFEVTAISVGLCGNSSVESSCVAMECPDVTLAIDPINDICRDMSTVPFSLTAVVTGDTTNGILSWTGNGVDASGMFDPDQAAFGPNTITLNYVDGACVYSDEIIVNIYDTPELDFTADATACVGDIITVNYTGTDKPNQTYFWDFDGGDTPDGIGPGPHSVSWGTGGTYTITLYVENADGCISETMSTEVAIESPLQTPIINCSSTTTSIVFSWNSVPGVSDSIISVSPNLNGVLQGSSYILDGVSPSTQVDFEMTLIGAGSCPPVTITSSCLTDDCPPVTLDIVEPTPLCSEAAAATILDVNIAGGSGTGTGSWVGLGIDPSSGYFDPSIAGAGMHTIKYLFEDSGCMFEDSVVVEVVQIPVADFSTQNLICMLDAATVTFTGIASSNANFIWDFGGGVAFPGIGPGPHQVTWNAPGSKTISLYIEDGNCSSATYDYQVQVDQDFSLSNITCSSTTESITFSWPGSQGVLGYVIEVLDPPSSAETINDTTYTISNLDAGTDVFFQVTPIAVTACPIAPVMANCSTDPCWDVDVIIQPVNPICLTVESVPVDLSVEVIGAPGTGTATWSGEGVVDQIGGTFDPQQAGEGVHVITYEYQIDNCVYTNETTIKVAFPPVADAGEDINITCWDMGEIFRLGGDDTSTGPNVIFEWTTNTGDLPDNSNILRPEITEAGTYTLTVTDLEFGCSSSDEVVVSLSLDIPEFSLAFSNPDCSGQTTTVAVDQITGGVEPFLFSLNGQPYVDSDTFPFLPAGSYNLALLDGAGCENEAAFELEETGELNLELTANLVGRNLIDAGDSIQLITVLSLSEDLIDSIVWTNTEFLSCTGCLNPMAAPTETTTFIVTAYMNGCFVSDELIIFVEQSNPVYVPNAFSPNGDKINDVFQIYPGSRVLAIHSFNVFDRWGDMVFSKKDFLPEDAPNNGWDGLLNGKEMNPAVFVWFAEIEFIDGSVKILKGDVTLTR